MRSDSKDKREQQIADAAYALLDEKGLQGLSMLAIAKRAKASNETLYRWYGDKLGLFRALITRNADMVAQELDANLTADVAPREVLQNLGPVLLGMLLSPKAIALNRAAAADASNALGGVLAEAGRGQIFPRISQVFETLAEAGQISAPADEAASLWITLLVGDWQVRCVTGAMPAPDAQAQITRARRADALLFQVLGPSASH